MEYPNIISTTLLSAPLAIGTSYVVACKVPSDATGGQLTVISAHVSSNIAFAAGSAPLVELVTLSTASVVDGTIGTVAAGAFTAGTPKALTIVDADAGDADKFIAWKVMGTAANVGTIVVTGFFNALPGI